MEMSAAQRNRAPRGDVGAVKKKRKKRSSLFQMGTIDIPFFALVMVLLTIGLLAMFSAGSAYAYYDADGDTTFYLKRQIVYAALGIIGMLTVSKINYNNVLRKLTLPVMVLSIFLLILVRAVTFEENHRAIYIGPLSFQPSEVAKFALILFMAQYMSVNQKKIQERPWIYGLLPPLLATGLICLLTVIEPHLSATMIIFAIGFILMFVGGSSMKRLIPTCLIGGGAAAFLAFQFGVIKPYQINRLLNWGDPFEDFLGNGWQTAQSLMAIGSGGLFGAGAGQSRQKYLYVSEPQNDFVFAIFCEEMGFIGALAVMVLFGLLVWRGFHIAAHASDKFGALLVTGITFQVGLQALLNIAVVTNTLMNTGVSLPFFSYGGSSLVMLLFEMGVVLSVSREASIIRR